MVNLWPWPRGQHWLDYTHINDWTPVRLIAWLASRYTHDLISSVNCNLLVFLIHCKNIDRSSIQCINGTCINIKVFRPFSLLKLNGTGNLFYKCFILTMSSHLLNCSAQVLICKIFWNSCIFRIEYYEFNFALKIIFFCELVLEIEH